MIKLTTHHRAGGPSFAYRPFGAFSAAISADPSPGSDTEEPEFDDEPDLPEEGEPTLPLSPPPVGQPGPDQVGGL